MVKHITGGITPVSSYTKSMNTIPQKKTGLSRIIAAFFYSIQGLQTTFKSEAAFRQEVTLFILLLPIVYLLPVSGELKCLLFLGNSLILIAELMNSAIEAVVDMTSPDYHNLAKQAKDIGSAAVLVAIITSVVIWCYAISLAIL
jgi:diacylglycerol kinase (ATP)